MKRLTLVGSERCTEVWYNEYSIDVIVPDDYNADDLISTFISDIRSGAIDNDDAHYSHTEGCDSITADVESIEDIE